MRLNLIALTGAAFVATALLAAPALASPAVTADAVKLFAGPGANFGTVGGLDANSKVGVLWCGNASFDWCLVQFHKQQGWVHIADLIGVDALDPVLDPTGKHVVLAGPHGNGGEAIAPEDAEAAPPHPGGNKPNPIKALLF